MIINSISLSEGEIFPHGQQVGNFGILVFPMKIIMQYSLRFTLLWAMDFGAVLLLLVIVSKVGAGSTAEAAVDK